MNACREVRLRGLLPSRPESISSSIPSPLTTRRIWSIIPSSRGGRTYEPGPDNDCSRLSFVADRPAPLPWIGVSHPSILAYSEEAGAYRALAISLLRLCALSLLISFALNPSFVERKEHKVSPALAILLDTSQSMGLSGHGGRGAGWMRPGHFCSTGRSPF